MSDPRCVSGPTECVSRTPDGAAATTQENTLCHGCIDAIQRQLEQLPSLVDALNCFKGGISGASYGGSRVSASSEPKAPLNVAVVDLIDEVWMTFGLTGGYMVRDLVTFEDGIPLALRIRKVHSKASKMAGFEPVWQQRAASCPNCLQHSLGGWIGSDLIQCATEACNASFTKTEYERICLEQSKKPTKKPRKARH